MFTKVKRKKKLDTNKLVIASHNLKSNALKNLAAALTQKVGYHVYRVTPDRILNRRNFTFLPGIDKVVQLESYRRASVCIPDFSLTRSGVDAFDCKRIVARALTNASEGRGITVFEKGDPVPYAPLYTAYIPKKKEFRVQVCNNEVIDVSEKRKKKTFEQERDAYVRNTANGYVFCRTAVVEPDDLRSLALAACKAIGRTYGAVDIIWNEKQNKCYVLEVNSRPGMEGTTVEKYASAILAGLEAEAGRRD